MRNAFEPLTWDPPQLASLSEKPMVYHRRVIRLELHAQGEQGRREEVPAKSNEKMRKERKIRPEVGSDPKRAAVDVGGRGGKCEFNLGELCTVSLASQRGRGCT